MGVKARERVFSVKARKRVRARVRERVREACAMRACVCDACVYICGSYIFGDRVLDGYCRVSLWLHQPRVFSRSVAACSASTHTPGLHPPPPFHPCNKASQPEPASAASASFRQLLQPATASSGEACGGVGVDGQTCECGDMSTMKREEGDVCWWMQCVDGDIIAVLRWAMWWG